VPAEGVGRSPEYRLGLESSGALASDELMAVAQRDAVPAQFAMGDP